MCPRSPPAMHLLCSFSQLTISIILIYISHSFLDKPVANAQKLDLDCTEFNSSCQWLNANTASASNSTLVWYRSSTVINADQLQITTGTNVLPNGSYAIASTIVVDSVNSSQSAMLVSALVPCQMSNATLSFSYWTSPFVLLNVCFRMEGMALNRTNNCQRAPFSQGPGPASFNFLPMANPFRFLIEASNFVYSNGQLTGGFAILDNVKYTGDYCTSTTAGSNGTTSAAAGNATASINGTSTSSIAPPNSASNNNSSATPTASSAPPLAGSSVNGNGTNLTSSNVTATAITVASPTANTNGTRT